MRVSKNRKVEPVTPVYKAKPLERREVPYAGDIDPAVIIHSSKTHSSVSEAFKDADYATSMWRCENDWDRTKDYLTWVVVWGATFGLLYLFMVSFDLWIQTT